MGKATFWIACVALLAACGGEAPQSGPPSVVPDAGEPVGQNAKTPPPVVTFTSPRGTLTGSQAFSIFSAEALLAMGDGGAPAYVGFQITDTGQCRPANIPTEDGGYAHPLDTTHLAQGFVRTLNGAPLLPGQYAIGENPDAGYQAYMQVVEYDRATGTSTTFLASSGTMTVTQVDGGHIEGGFEVQLFGADYLTPMAFTGSYIADSCLPP